MTSLLPGDPADTVGGVATPRALCVLAPNPSPMTLDGTNTWLLSEPDSDLAVVIDPGPLDEGHLRRVVQAAEQQGKRVALTLLTHGHHDHAEGAARFAELTGTRVRALDPAHRLGDEGLHGGQRIEVGGLEIRVIGTPGHTADSLTFHLPADGAVLTGDTVLGRGTTMVAHPDGRLGDYLDSLRRLHTMASDHGVRTVLPGHGPVLADALGAVDYYLAHRASRLAQVETAVEAGCRTAEQVVARVYADVDRSLWPAAELSVRAQLSYLEDHGLI
ncbi:MULTISPECIES: MBL fold metallo-hydrolase [Kitasatospora]|uniref:Glyoxylase-like metal-dependent hydrolase (Beta-lactamase superfamily II) n=2 Tax=Kitasatospora TaxID=2063 RepID=A0ABT1J626_9ACTN|nr:MBL fold metallo-hydrolase [Kitasatospora paracochleata]MCP2312890.1 glyoxylase-like metal-dependent hydrolase (beta-lactamase superfamily II) [Kitasatospora paracochleata]